MVKNPIWWRTASFIIGIGIAVWQGVPGAICAVLGMLLGAWICMSGLANVNNG